MSNASDHAFDYRIAFGVWINDMRTEPLPLEDWPAPQLDDHTVDSIIRAMDMQGPAGFKYLDVWGLFATFGWPLDIVSALDDERRRLISRLLAAAKVRGIEVVLGLGTYSWGYDHIIAADPELRGKEADGSPHPHAMCDASPRAFEWVKKIIDFCLGEFDFGGVHLESCDLGCCHCPECAGKDGVVGYNVRINQKTADYIKTKWPEKFVYVITISWIPALQHMNAQEMDHVVELGKHVDCIFDQGHRGFHIDPQLRREFISRLDCAYGTSGQMWMYPDTRWDRTSYFLPYPWRAGEALKQLYADGVRGCMHYQGPVINPGQEMNIAVGGRILADTSKSVDDAVGEVLAAYYKPKSDEALTGLRQVFRQAEEAFFGQWQEEPFRRLHGAPMPGEWIMTNNLFGTAPGPAAYLREPYLDAAGRKAYKAGLCEILKDLPQLAEQCDDDGRIKRIQSGIIVTLTMLATVMLCQGEG